MKHEVINADVEEVFKKLDLPIQPNQKNFEVWEVTPLKKGMRIFFETC